MKDSVIFFNRIRLFFKFLGLNIFRAERFFFGFQFPVQLVLEDKFLQQ